MLELTGSLIASLLMLARLSVALDRREFDEIPLDRLNPPHILAGARERVHPTDAETSHRGHGTDAIKKQQREHASAGRITAGWGDICLLS